ncbi:hypothetical protein PanWU01x14_164540 [Parasponia andersonii]|uniref:Uncharacterized protein n=1 Tax=Parasponia andersonii TaxID=3476 RepID=A0A2P5CCG1_PARAD|nr:hypothetical protein PanWU01x14_164540 [Parasponia andersonii]
MSIIFISDSEDESKHSIALNSTARKHLEEDMNKEVNSPAKRLKIKDGHTDSEKKDMPYSDKEKKIRVAYEIVEAKVDAEVAKYNSQVLKDFEKENLDEIMLKNEEHSEMVAKKDRFLGA